MSEATVLVEPTGEQCSANAKVRIDLGKEGIVEGTAAWYPQMGGYVGRCVIVPCTAEADGHACFEVYVWHDGSFPFSTLDNAWGDAPRQPVHLHHCVAEHFIEFGNLAEKVIAEASHR